MLAREETPSLDEGRSLFMELLSVFERPLTEQGGGDRGGARPWSSATTTRSATRATSMTATCGSVENAKRIAAQLERVALKEFAWSRVCTWQSTCRPPRAAIAKPAFTRSWWSSWTSSTPSTPSTLARTRCTDRLDLLDISSGSSYLLRCIFHVDT